MFDRKRVGKWINFTPLPWDTITLGHQLSSFCFHAPVNVRVSFVEFQVAFRGRAISFLLAFFETIVPA